MPEYEIPPRVPGHTPTGGGTSDRTVIPPSGGSGRHTIIVPPRPSGTDLDPPPPIDPAPTTPIAPPPGSPSKPTNQDARTRTLTFGAHGQAVPIVYGKAEVGGDCIFARTASNYVYLAMAVSEGPVQSITGITIGGEIPSKLGATVNVHLGTADQAVDGMLAAIEHEWKWALPGTAYVAYKMSITNDEAAKVDPKDFRCIVEGLLVRDYAQDPTLVTRYYSENPIWAIADIFTSRRYGIGERDARLDWANSFTAAAAICDGEIAAAITAPTGAPTVANDTTGDPGLLDPAGTYTYQVTFVETSAVESLPGPASSSVSPANGKVAVSAIDTGGVDVKWRRLYRTKSAGTTPRQLATTIYDNTTTTFSDNVGDTSLGKFPNDQDGIKRFRIGININSPSTGAQLLDELRGHCASYYVFNNGLYQVFVDDPGTDSGITFDENTISGMPTITTLGLAEIPTKVTVGYTDQQNKFALAEASDEDPNVSNPPTDAERLEKREFRYQYYGIPTYDQAFRIANWIRLRGQMDKTIEWRTNQLGTRPIPGTVLRIKHEGLHIPDDPELEGSGPLVVVTSSGPDADSLGWNLKGEFVRTFDTTFRDPDQPPEGGGEKIDPPGSPPPVISDYVLRAQFWISQGYEVISG